MSDITLQQQIRGLAAQLERLRKTDVPGVPGTWTPSLVGSTIAGTFTYTVQAGTYTRLADTLLFRCRVQISAIAVAPTGNLQINGLPYTSVAIGAAGVSGGGQLAMWQGITLPAGYTQLMARMLSGNTFLNLSRGGSNSAQALVQGGELVLVGGVANFDVQGQYQL